MKRFLLIFTIATGTAPAFAQSVSVGPELGLNLYTATDEYTDVFGRKVRETYETMPGFKIGGIADFKLSRLLYFQPGLFYSMKGFKYSTATADYKIHLNYIEVPINLQLKFGLPALGKFFVGAGPYLAMAAGGKVDRDPGSQSDLEFGNDAGDDFKTFDVGLGINAGLEFRNGFFIRGAYSAGVSNVAPDDGYDAKEHIHGASITVGYLFGVL